MARCMTGNGGHPVLPEAQFCIVPRCPLCDVSAQLINGKLSLHGELGSDAELRTTLHINRWS